MSIQEEDPRQVKQMSRHNWTGNTLRFPQRRWWRVSSAHRSSAQSFHFGCFGDFFHLQAVDNRGFLGRRCCRAHDLMWPGLCWMGNDSVQKGTPYCIKWRPLESFFFDEARHLESCSFCCHLLFVTGTVFCLDSFLNWPIFSWEIVWNCFDFLLY